MSENRSKIIQTLSQSYQKTMPKWSENDPKMIPKWPPNGPKVTPKWFQNDSKMIPKWHRNDTKMIPKWFQNDLQMIPKWSRIFKFTSMSLLISAPQGLLFFEKDDIYVNLYIFGELLWLGDPGGTSFSLKYYACRQKSASWNTQPPTHARGQDDGSYTNSLKWLWVSKKTNVRLRF